MTVLVPADATEAYKAVLAAAEVDGPVYIRLGRYPTPVIFDAEYRFEVGAVPLLREGEDIVLYTMGIMAALGLETADLLSAQGVEAAVLNVSTLLPLNATALVEAAEGKSLCVSMEEHWITGGLGSAVAETLAEVRGTAPLLRIGVRDQFGQSATADELLEHYGLTPKQMADAVLRALDS
jgi:transketolase